jgi:hypothetical protein
MASGKRKTRQRQPGKLGSTSRNYQLVVYWSDEDDAFLAEAARQRTQSGVPPASRRNGQRQEANANEI